MYHKPVLLQEILDALALRPGAVVVDGTLGGGGHARAILERIGPTGRLIGLDQDPKAVMRCRELFSGDPQVTVHHENFRYFDKILEKLNISNVDAVILDVGISSDQLADVQRGFSFQSQGELDMRMNPEIGLKASELLQQMSETELTRLFQDYGNERHAARFAHAIVKARYQTPVKTVNDLVGVIEASLPYSLRFKKGHRPQWAKRHPATKIFQALRIVVNDELAALRDGIVSVWKCLALGGRFGIISFHSLEDRIVKQEFRKYVQEKCGQLVFKKPVIPSREEILNNPRARSAKLRVITRIS